VARWWGRWLADLGRNQTTTSTGDMMKKPDTQRSNRGIEWLVFALVAVVVVIAILFWRFGGS